MKRNNRKSNQTCNLLPKIAPLLPKERNDTFLQSDQEVENEIIAESFENGLKLNSKYILWRGARGTKGHRNCRENCESSSKPICNSASFRLLPLLCSICLMPDYPHFMFRKINVPRGDVTCHYPVAPCPLPLHLCLFLFHNVFVVACRCFSLLHSALPKCTIISVTVHGFGEMWGCLHFSPSVE